MVLATIACVYRIVARIPVVVDRHTTFLLTKKYRNTPPIILFKLLHRFTIRFASLTIVTNQFLAQLVTKLNGKAFVLPDKIPEIRCSTPKSLKGKINILLISSFGIDEPINECLEAMRMFDNNCVMYITGNYKKLDDALIRSKPENVKFTGYVPVGEYEELLCSADIVMALTTADHCMLCGCYEAIAAEKPLITSNKKALKDYFSKATFTDNTSKGIVESIKEVIADPKRKKIDIINLKAKLTFDWKKTYTALENELKRL
jgi:glycosyltransferase involved in cell wall biosynthesis